MKIYISAHTKVDNNSISKTRIYTLDGMTHTTPQKGLNIIHTNNGVIKKVLKER